MENADENTNKINSGMKIAWFTKDFV